MEQPVTFEYTLTVRHCIDTIVNHLRRVDVEPRPVIADILTQFESIVGQFPQGCQIALSCSKSAVQSTGSLTTLKVTGFCIP